MAEWAIVVVLGVIQGLTEFLPVSSSGHLAVGQLLFGLKEGNLALSITLHAGTLLATLWYFRQRLTVIVGDLLSSYMNPARALQTSGGIDLRTVVLASIPTALIGLAIEPLVEQWTVEPLVVAAGFALTGGLLLVTTRLARGEADAPGAWGALLVGLAQGVAVLPGVSRSGSTIVVLLLLGVRSARAFELSMLISLPAVCGAFLLEFSRDLTGARPGGQLLLGTAVAFGVGLLALHWLRGVVTQGRLAWFAAWVLPLSIVVAAAAGGRSAPAPTAVHLGPEFHGGDRDG